MRPHRRHVAVGQSRVSETSRLASLRLRPVRRETACFRARCPEESQAGACRPQTMKDEGARATRRLSEVFRPDFL